MLREAVDLVMEAKLIQNLEGITYQKIAAGLVSREGLFVDQEDGVSALREPIGTNRPGRTGSGNGDVPQLPFGLVHSARIVISDFFSKGRFSTLSGRMRRSEVIEAR